MHPCIRCCAAIGNAEKRCPVCGTVQTWPGWRAGPPAQADLLPDSDVEDDDGDWLVATVSLCGLVIMGLSLLAFGSSGVFVAMGVSVLCWIVVGLMGSCCV